MSAPVRWLRFAAGGLEAMVPAAAVRRTLPAPDPLPAVLELAGEAYAVVDLADVAELPARPDHSPSLLLVLDDGETRMVLPVDAVGGLVAPPDERIEPLPWPYEADGGWCAGVMVPDGADARPVVVVDPAALARTVTVGEEVF